MPITYVIDRFRQRIWTQVDGLVTCADIAAHLDAEARDHGIDLPELIDARFATTTVTPAEIRTLVLRVQQMVRTHPFGPTAIVTANDVVVGMVRMFAILVDQDGVAIEVFRDVQSGWEWLDKATQHPPNSSR